MNIFASKRGNTAAFPLKPVAAGCAVFMTMLAASAQAQEAAAATDAPMQSVTVSGIRTGIEAAISIKKNSTSIVEAISAEDLGKLPDTSVAESISRLPGVTAQRSAKSGKAADISVRGLSPSFNGTLLNGREQASTGNARSPEFDLFPAELMGSVVIYKTPDAQLVGSGLAATIDLRTVQPLDFGKRTIAASYRKARIGVRSGGEEGDGDKYNFSYVDQFADRTIGLALGFSKMKETGVSSQKFNSWGGWAPTMDYNGSKVVTPGGFGGDTESSSNDRDGAMASLQFRPNKNFKSTLDFFYSSGSTSQKKTGLEGAVGGNSAGTYDPNGVLTNATIVNGVATAGTITNYKGVIRNHVEAADDDLKTFGWNNQWRQDGWTLIADLTHSKASKQATRYETTGGLPGNATSLDTISWTGFNGSNFTDVQYKTGLNYTDRNVMKLTDVMGWSGGPASPQAGYVALPHIDDKVRSIRLSAKHDVEWGPVVGVTGGFNYTKRDKARTGREGRLVIKGGDPYGTAAIPGTETSVAGTTGIPVAMWNPIGSLGTIYDISDKVDSDILNKDWSVSEKVSTAYFMGDLDGELFGLSYSGNVGAQIVHTNQRGTGNQVDQAKCTGNTAATCPSMMVSDGKSYTDVLPSLNLSFDLGNDQKLRFGAAKVVSRPNLDDMRSSMSFSIPPTAAVPILVGNGGNPKLDPFKAKSLDLSYEKYFDKKAYISGAVFYKKLDTYIYRAPRAFDFTPFLSPGTVLPASGPYAGSAVGLMTQPQNGNGGNIKGFELSANLPFSLVTSYLDGFGLIANFSNTNSKISLPTVGFSASAGDAVTIPLPGLSRQVTNLRLYYEKNGFQVAAAARKRSNFLGQVSDFQDNQQLTFIKGETIVDLQASYEFQSGFAKGLSVFVQANNWNNAKWQQYVTSPDAVTESIKYGRTYYMGASYKF